MRRSRAIRIGVGLGLSLLFLYFSMKGVDRGQVLHSLREARYAYLIPAMITVVLSFYVRAVRWRVILQPVRSVSAANSFAATMIGFMANNVLPMRAGEVLRAVVIGRRESMSRSAALATIVVERVFDMVILLLVLLLGAMGHDLPRELEGAIWVVSGGTAAVLVLFAVLARTRQRAGERVARLLGSNVRWGARVGQLVDSFQGGLAIMGRLGHGLVVLLLSIVVWGLFVATYHFSLAAFGLQLGARAPILLLGIVSLGVMLPSAPGYIGTMQYFFTVAVAPFGVEKALALSASWFFWVAQYIPVTAIGLLYFWRENVTFRTALGEEEAGEAALARGGEDGR